MLHQSSMMVVMAAANPYYWLVYDKPSNPQRPDLARPDSPRPDPQRVVRKWLTNVVGKLELCPYAKPLLRSPALRLATIDGGVEACLRALACECKHLDDHPATETTLLILESGCSEFDDYLDLLAMAENLLSDLGYDGIYQLASFHPDYQFSGTEPQAVENFTNRSPYPIVHLLREGSITRALAESGDPGAITTRNIDTMRTFGQDEMARLLDRCFDE